MRAFIALLLVACSPYEPATPLPDASPLCTPGYYCRPTAEALIHHERVWRRDPDCTEHHVGFCIGCGYCPRWDMDDPRWDVVEDDPEAACVNLCAIGGMW